MTCRYEWVIQSLARREAAPLGESARFVQRCSSSNGSGSGGGKGGSSGGAKAATASKQQRQLYHTMVEGKRFEVGETVRIKAPPPPAPRPKSSRRAAAANAPAGAPVSQFALVVAIWEDAPSGATFAKWRTLIRYVATPARSLPARACSAPAACSEAHGLSPLRSLFPPISPRHDPGPAATSTS